MLYNGIGRVKKEILLCEKLMKFKIESINLMPTMKREIEMIHLSKYDGNYQVTDTRDVSLTQIAI